MLVSTQNLSQMNVPSTDA